MPRDRPTTTSNIASWIESQAKLTRRSKAIPYDYFGFASMLQQSKTTTNLAYLRALTRAKIVNPQKLNHIEIMENKMKQRDNINSTFGRKFSQYWEERDDAESSSRIKTMQRKTREQIVKNTTDYMSSISSEVTGISSKPQEIIEERGGPSTSAAIELLAEEELSVEEELPKEDSLLVSTEESRKLSQEDRLQELLDLSKSFTLNLSDLNIIDLTDHTVYDLYKESLSEYQFAKLNEPVVEPWKEEPACKKLLNALCQDQVDQRDLCEIIRAPVIEPRDYRPRVHYDLRTIENVAGSWIDLMCSPVNPLLKEHGERTSAMDGVILILKNLFRPFNDLVNMKWIEIEDNSTKRHKWDGLLSKVDGKATVMLIEFAGGFTNYDLNKLRSDTKKVYRTAARLLNNKDSAPDHQPRIFVVLSHNYKIYFECITLVTNRVYVRTRKAVMDVPYSPSGLKIAMQRFPDVFAWRNTVIRSIQQNVPSNNANLETIPVPETP